MFQAPGSTFSTVRHEIHRSRKGALLPFFSRQKISRQQAIIRVEVQKACQRLRDEYEGTSKVLRLNDMLSCLTSDIIMKFAFDRSYGFLDYPDFISPFTRAMSGLTGFSHYAIQFPLLPVLLSKVPDAVMAYLSADVYEFQKFLRVRTLFTTPT